MKIHELTELSEKEREEKLSDLREEYFNLKFQMATGKIENPGRMKYMRRDIARILTLKANPPVAEPSAVGKEKEGKPAKEKEGKPAKEKEGKLAKGKESKLAADKK